MPVQGRDRCSPLPKAWERLAAELHSTAGSYESVVTGVTAGPWLGPSSATMAAAASSYVAWMSSTAAQAEQAAEPGRSGRRRL